MRSKPFSITTSLTAVATLFLALGSGLPAFARPGAGDRDAIRLKPRADRVIYVNEDADGADTGESWADAFTELQSALVGSWGGDEIWVAVGTYNPDFDVDDGVHTGDRVASFSLKSGVALYGGFAGDEDSLDERAGLFDQTVLSGDLDWNDEGNACDSSRSENSLHVVTSVSDLRSTILDGFKITAGNASGSDEYALGGGMYNLGSSPTVRNCIFQSNCAGSAGGGMFNRARLVRYGTIPSNPRLIDCAFVDNACRSEDCAGGAMYNDQSDLILENCTFRGNIAGRWSGSGGGMYNVLSSPQLTNCTFESNRTADVDDTGRGGGAGGGMCNLGSSPTLVNCTFRENCASGGSGGGMYNQRLVDEPFRYPANPTLVNCLFIRNDADHGGGAIANSGSHPQLTNCTLVANSANGWWRRDDDFPGLGGGVFSSFDSAPVARNCIVWGNTDTDPDGTTRSAQIHGPADVTYGLVEGGWPGIGNIDADPMFVDADGPDDRFGTADDNVRLLPCSPAIDAGDPDFDPGAWETDLDGQPRIIDGVVNMGAYEGPPLFGDSNLDGVFNMADLNVMVDWLVGREPMPELGTLAFIVSDVNGDGVLNQADLDLYVDHLLRRIDWFPVEDPCNP